jgi:hypothetical protein
VGRKIDTPSQSGSTDKNLVVSERR